MPISKKMKDFAASGSWIRRMFEQGVQMKARYGAENVFDFSLGNPDLAPPDEFQAALARVVAAEAPGVHGYMANSGYAFARAAVAGEISRQQGVALGQEEVIMTCGAAGALNVVMKALLDPGDEVIVLSPYFVEYLFYVDNHGGIIKVVPTAAEFSLDLSAIEAAITPRTKAIIINSPNNPTGQIYSAAELAALAELLAAAGRRYNSTIFLVADEPYRQIVYDGHTVPAIFAAWPHSIIVSSYSKDLSLPGERIGYLAVHPAIAEKTPLLAALTLANRILGFVNAPALMQRVVAELQGVTVDTSIYARRRELFCRVLTEAGYEFIPPKGAFYLFPKSPIPEDATFVALLQEQKILAVPGRGFGAPGYFRLAFCVADAIIKAAGPGFKKAAAAAKG